MISRRDLMKGIAAAAAFLGLKPETRSDPFPNGNPLDGVVTCDAQSVEWGFKNLTVYESNYSPIVINQESADRLRVPLQMMHEACQGDHRAKVVLDHAIEEAWNRGAL